jgi:hypothetical protein
MSIKKYKIGAQKDGIVLCTHLSADRINKLFVQCLSWLGGNVNASVYCRKKAESDLVEKFIHQMTLRKICNMKLIVYEVYGEKLSDLSPMYPTNYMRNLSLSLSESDDEIILLIDIDLIPSSYFNITAQINYSSIKEQILTNKYVIVFPAFELANNIEQKNFFLSMDVNSLLGPIEKNDVYYFHKPVYPFGHKNTNYPEWIKQESKDVGYGYEKYFKFEYNYDVKYSYGYEPWLVTCRKLIPFFDEDFTDYGFNKIIGIHNICTQDVKLVTFKTHFLFDMGYHPASHFRSDEKYMNRMRDLATTKISQNAIQIHTITEEILNIPFIIKTINSGRLNIIPHFTMISIIRYHTNNLSKGMQNINGYISNYITNYVPKCTLSHNHNKAQKKIPTKFLNGEPIMVPIKNLNDRIFRAYLLAYQKSLHLDGPDTKFGKNTEFYAIINDIFKNDITNNPSVVFTLLNSIQLFLIDNVNSFDVIYNNFYVWIKRQKLDNNELFQFVVPIIEYAVFRNNDKDKKNEDIIKTLNELHKWIQEKEVFTDVEIFILISLFDIIDIFANNETFIFWPRYSHKILELISSIPHQSPLLPFLQLRITQKIPGSDKYITVNKKMTMDAAIRLLLPHALTLTQELLPINNKIDSADPNRFNLIDLVDLDPNNLFNYF